MTEKRLCPKCEAELPLDAPQGLCPKCLLDAGLESQVTGSVGNAATGAFVTPSQEASAANPPSPRFPIPRLETLARQFPQLDNFEHLGQGGMGVVFKARQRSLNRLVAVKILPPSVGDDPAFAERFTREAQFLARLNHPHIVQVYEFGQTDESFYFIMEYVDGVNLRALIREGTLKPEEALKIVPQICEALQVAHDEGIVHRDMKPENILLDKKGQVKIADFGLAKLLGQAGTDFTLTGTQQVMGTLHYMAPEQMQGSRDVDHRADIYSLGVVFYEMLTGQLPIGRFEPPSKKVLVDVRLDEVVLRSLETEPDRRYQHASQVKTDVEAISSGPCSSVAPHSARESPETAPAGNHQATPPLGRLTQHWTGRLFLLSAITVVGYGVSKVFRAEIGDMMWSLVLVLSFMGFAVDEIRRRKNNKALQAAFLFLAATTPVLVSLTAEPSEFLDWLYRVSGGTPGKRDIAFLRVVFGGSVVGLVWQMVQVYRRIAVAKDAGKVKTDEETFSSGPRPAATSPSALESQETAPAGNGQVTSLLRRLTQHWTGQLFLLAATAVVGYAGYTSFLLGIGGAMFSLVLVLCFLGFAVDVIRNRGNLRGLQAAFPLLAGSIALLIYLAAQPSPFLDWLYRVSSEKPGEGDSAFLRVIISFIVVSLVWQMVEVYRKIAAAKDAGNAKTHAKQGQRR